MAGQILIIPGVGAKAIPAAATTPVSAKYTVRPDDTLWEIAANYGLSLNELLAANPGVDPRRLMAGQQLVIPGISQEVLTAVQAPPPAPARRSGAGSGPGDRAGPGPRSSAAPARPHPHSLPLPRRPTSTRWRRPW